MTEWSAEERITTASDIVLRAIDARPRPIRQRIDLVVAFQVLTESAASLRLNQQAIDNALGHDAKD